MKYAGLIFVIIAAMFSGINALDGELVSDDFILLDVAKHQPVTRIFTTNWLGDRGEGGFYRPAVILSMKVDHLIYGDDARGYHRSNVMMHMLIVVLIYLLIYRFHEDAWVASIAAGLFSLHPVHVEAVAWISGRTDLVAVLFYLLSLYLFFRMASDSSRGCLTAFMSLGAGFMAMCSKEIAYTLPFTILVMDQLQNRQEMYPVRRSRHYISYFALLLAILIIRYFILGGLLGGYGPEKHLRFDMVIFNYLSFYFQWLITPAGVFLARHSTAWNLAHLSLLVLSGVALFSPKLRWGAVWFWITILPVLNICRAQYLYLPSIGFVWVLAVLIRNGKWPDRTIPGDISRIIIFATLMMVFGLQTAEMNREWTRTGRTGAGIREVLLSEYPDLPSGSRVIFINPPVNTKISIAVFQNGITEAVRLWYDDRTLSGIRVNAPSQIPDFNPDKDIVFEFQKDRIRNVTDLIQGGSDDPEAFDPAFQWVTLSHENPAFEIVGPGAVFSGVVLDTQLSNAVWLQDGAAVAAVDVVFESGEIETFILEAGRDTAEWAYDRPDVRARAAHSRGPVAYSYLVDSSGAASFPGHTYRARMMFERPGSVRMLKILFKIDKRGPHGAVSALEIRNISGVPFRGEHRDISGEKGIKQKEVLIYE